MKRILSLIAFVMLMAVFAFSADLDHLKVVQKMTVPAITPGQPPQEITIISYISPKGYMYDWGQGAYLLYIAAESKFYIVSPNTKGYSPVEYEKVKPMIDQLDMMMGGEITATSENTGKKEKVGDWDAEIWKFIFKSPMVQMEITSWNSTKYIATPLVYKYFGEMEKFQGKRGIMTREMMKSAGLPLKMEVTMTAMGQTSKFSSITTFISEDPIPDSILEIPKDYKEVPVDPAAFQNAFM